MARIKCHECAGTLYPLPVDHAAWCSTGRIAELQDEVARLREALATMLRTHGDDHEWECEAAGYSDEDIIRESGHGDCECGMVGIRAPIRAALSESDGKP